MRAREPDAEGYVNHDGVKVGYAVYGEGDRTVLLAPGWLVVDSRIWKLQVAYLARYFRVITVDPRGNGRSDRPTDPAAYTDRAHAMDLVAALDAAGADRAVVAGLSRGGWRAAIAAAEHPERFTGLVAIAPRVLGLAPPPPERAVVDFEAVRERYEGWQQFNRHFWRRDYRAFVEWFFAMLLSEPHSTRQFEECVGWALETGPEALIAGEEAPASVPGLPATEALLRGLRCPVLVIHGENDRCVPVGVGERFAELTGGRLIRMAGAGHLPPARHPVPVNRWLRGFVDECGPPSPQPPLRWSRALDQPRRVLYLSSPIGLGHARRDLAIVAELRRLRPGVRVDWLAQHPVTALLAARGERVHPASRWLASESRHVEAEAHGHDLHAFQAIRRMDEILAANFMVFADLAEERRYDLWVGDEAWDVDRFLHENPELKRAAYAWLTDFVGWLPMAAGGPAEAALTADANAEMIEHIERFPRVRDRALFVGDPEDVLAGLFGPGLPAIADWTARHYDFTGYVTGFPPADLADRQAARAEFGWGPQERVCLVAVGGTAVGVHLLRRALAAYPSAARQVPGLRMVVVAGPRIDPGALAAPPGVDVHSYLPELHRYLAAADLAVVQGGLSTTMELTAAGRPFLYVPLENHFEQQLHVPHRLARYGAGRRVAFADTGPEQLARAIAEEIGRTVRYRPVTHDGAVRAANRLAELI
ncbi:alpha/beta hydrolase [Actinoplanes sp. ATCC 53533]|uniref:alpha/beta hydrolase n=1 Tax=Actinoplanes sp. ATCC 53533 TaxID=1288362 RepID=UPI000F7B4056|nr:alpha/beta hydrolase [Actinoplanes sp. ATCC 53533]RSM58195.1 alpha/beta hydrolase [Actinoplanes sp. ATCC 53533]